MDTEKIIIRGARQHNLKNIDVELPRNKLVVITGLSGSGKSSLAFDTLYAEGQRRYVESLSTYARQFLERMEKPDVDLIEGLSPSIAIEQKTASRNPRSTVGTVTEIYDYLRLLFARIGLPHCYQCGQPIASQSLDQIVDRVMLLSEGTKINILSPVVSNQKGTHEQLLKRLKKEGFARVRIDGKITEIEDVSKLVKNKKHSIEVVVDRLIVKQKVVNRLADSLELAMALSEGLVTVDAVDQNSILFSEKLACIQCGISYPEFSPASFSFNSPQGACTRCDGLGSTAEFDPELLVPNPELSLREGAVDIWANRNSMQFIEFIDALTAHYGVDNRESDSIQAREEIKRYLNLRPCPECGGARLNRASRSMKVGGLSIHEVTTLSVSKTHTFFKQLELSGKRAAIAQRILKEIIERLGFLENVGLSYLTLDRSAHSLSGGESQRIRLATQIGSKLTGVLYVLDEPSIGLHQRDNQRLLQTLLKMRDIGNTVLIVEHDEETILQADYVVDMGPAAGLRGGQVVFAGTPQALLQHDASLTGKYLAGRMQIEVPRKRRNEKGPRLILKGACQNNLKKIDVAFPLGCFICVTGVSGSG